MLSIKLRRQIARAALDAEQRGDDYTTEIMSALAAYGITPADPKAYVSHSMNITELMDSLA